MDTKKYIIEIPDNTAWLQWVKVSDKDGHVCFDFKDPEDLTLYTEPDAKAVSRDEVDKIYDEARERGYKEGQARGYQEGLYDAWDAARKIFEYNATTLKKIFCKCCYSVVRDILRKYSASEVIEKIRQYEQEQEEIKVGYEVDGKGGRGIITKISADGDHFNVMWENGSTGYYMIEDFKKTGRHFPEIAEVLRNMQEEKE